MISASFQLQCVNLVRWTGGHSADQHLIGDGRGWWWMVISHGKISNSMNMSVQSKIGTSRWWNCAVSCFFLSTETCCGLLFIQASWDCLLTACTYWLGRRDLLLSLELLSLSFSSVALSSSGSKTWYWEAKYTRIDLSLKNIPVRSLFL